MITGEMLAGSVVLWLWEEASDWGWWRSGVTQNPSDGAQPKGVQQFAGRGHHTTVPEQQKEQSTLGFTPLSRAPSCHI